MFYYRLYLVRHRISHIWHIVRRHDMTSRINARSVSYYCADPCRKRWEFPNG